MSDINQEENLDTQVALLVANGNSLCRSLDRLTEELKRTNESVQGLTSDQRVMRMEVERVKAEIFAPDSSSRIRTCELHIRGLYAVGIFIAAGIAGELLVILSHWSVFTGGINHR